MQKCKKKQIMVLHSKKTARSPNTETCYVRSDNVTAMVGKVRSTDEFSGLDGMNARLTQQ